MTDLGWLHIVKNKALVMSQCTTTFRAQPQPEQGAPNCSHSELASSGTAPKANSQS